MENLLAQYENSFGEYEYEIIRKGFEEGLTPGQIALYARPQFCGEEMEVILDGIKAGLSTEQLYFIINSDTDWMEKEKICIGFMLGMSLEEMESVIFVDGDYDYDNLDSRIEALLENFAEENVPIANKIAGSYDRSNISLSTQAEQLLQAFYLKYIEEGYQYSGSIKKEDLLSSGYAVSVIDELIEKGIVRRRDVEVECYELSMIERYCLIKENDALTKWEQHGGDYFRLNNGYYGEFHRVLRAVLNSQVPNQVLENGKGQDLQEVLSLLSDVNEEKYKDYDDAVIDRLADLNFGYSKNFIGLLQKYGDEPEKMDFIDEVLQVFGCNARDLLFVMGKEIVEGYKEELTDVIDASENEQLTIDQSENLDKRYFDLSYKIDLLENVNKDRVEEHVRELAEYPEFVRQVHKDEITVPAKDNLEDRISAAQERKSGRATRKQKVSKQNDKESSL